MGNLKDTASEFEKLEAIIKLNEELTSENSRLLTELEEMKQELDGAETAAYWAYKEDRR